MTNMLLQTLQSLKEHRRKYAVVFLVGVIAFSWAVHKVETAARQAVLTGESLLHLSPRNVRNVPLLGLSGDKKAPYIPPESKVTLVTKQPNSLLSSNRTETLSFKEWGFTHEIGLEVNPFPVGFGLDFKWFYINRLGTGIGVNYFLQANSRYVTPTLNLSYHLDKIPFLTSTELVLGYSPLGPMPAYIALRLTIGK